MRTLVDGTVVAILAGGRGERLRPLTNHLAKPEVVYGGKYRIVDFVLNNCIHSSLNRIVVVPQYKYWSLGKHLSLGWSIFNPEKDEFLIFSPPQMGVSEGWYESTADSIYHNLEILGQNNPERVLILAGDAVYKMDYRPLLQFHEENGAELTIATLPIPVQTASRFGVMQIDERQRVVGFEEKPLEPKTIPGNPTISLVNMGIYVFNSAILYRELEADMLDPDSSHDFGKDVIPAMIKRRRKVYSYAFQDDQGQPQYWRDIGTLDAYYEANMDLLDINPKFNLYDEDWFWRTRQKQLPSAKFNFGARIEGTSIVGDGCILDQCRISHSILSPKVKVGSHVEIIDSIIMDGAEIQDGSRIVRAIIDKNNIIPAGSIIEAGKMRFSGELETTSSGIVIVPEIRTLWQGKK